MTYGYIRVSTDKQTVKNQSFEIEEFAARNKISIDSWIEETASGTITPEHRELGKLIEKISNGDLIICSELSRLGRSLFMIMSILNKLMEKGARVWTIKDGYRLGDDIQSKVLAFAFGLSAEIERNLISQRTKEALERKKSEGKKLGRPQGSLNKICILDGAELGTSIMIIHGISINQIAKLYGVHRKTVATFIKNKKLTSKENIERTLQLIGQV
ncbi:MAG: master DNA invertase Mpi family serine-type recombinase [Treponema sp.]|nr:master DNA invertase Mpi family serine-type recombinase [Treponema sp.]